MAALSNDSELLVSISIPAPPADIAPPKQKLGTGTESQLGHRVWQSSDSPKPSKKKLGPKPNRKVVTRTHLSWRWKDTDVSHCQKKEVSIDEENVFLGPAVIGGATRRLRVIHQSLVALQRRAQIMMSTTLVFSEVTGGMMIGFRMVVVDEIMAT
ncbi:hypothetical protein K438DRAFT_1789185 [Mycena galopus ATCC 62051]|nr:hypothetical protein K438DRAFT_1789185 [Mycena galopus ATCC 62051]